MELRASVRIMDFCILLQVTYIHFYLACYFTCCVCMQTTRGMLRALEISLHEVYPPIFLLNHVTLFCSLKILLLSATPP